MNGSFGLGGAHVFRFMNIGIWIFAGTVHGVDDCRWKKTVITMGLQRSRHAVSQASREMLPMSAPDALGKKNRKSQLGAVFHFLALPMREGKITPTPAPRMLGGQRCGVGSVPPENGQDDRFRAASLFQQQLGFPLYAKQSQSRRPPIHNSLTRDYQMELNETQICAEFDRRVANGIIVFNREYQTIHTSDTDSKYRISTVPAQPPKLRM